MQIVHANNMILGKDVFAHLVQIEPSGVNSMSTAKVWRMRTNARGNMSSAMTTAAIASARSNPVTIMTTADIMTAIVPRESIATSKNAAFMLKFASRCE